MGWRFGWEVLDHPSYSADLAPSDFHLFRFLKNYLGGMSFDNEDVYKEGFQIVRYGMTRRWCLNKLICLFIWIQRLSEYVSVMSDLWHYEICSLLLQSKAELIFRKLIKRPNANGGWVGWFCSDKIYRLCLEIWNRNPAEQAHYLAVINEIIMWENRIKNLKYEYKLVFFLIILLSYTNITDLTLKISCAFVFY